MRFPKQWKSLLWNGKLLVTKHILKRATLPQLNGQ
jgi:hypothetical protein